MVIVSALPTDELLSVGLGQPMAARAFLRGVRRVCFDYHYAAQSGLVQNELEQLIERPLRLFGVAANLSLANVLQFFQHNALSGHPKPANEGHLKTGQRESPGH